MMPASISQIPRLGEYDIICHHCCANLDSLHKSISQHSDSTNNKEGSGGGPVDNKNYPGPWCTANGRPFDSPTMAGSYVQLAALGQPPFFSHLQAPFVGMCLVDVRSSAWPTHLLPPPLPSLGPSRVSVSTTPSSSGSSNHSRLNPEALAFAPAGNSQLPTPPLTPPARQVPPDAGTPMHPVESVSSESNRNIGRPENTMEEGSSEKSLCDALFPTPPETETSPSDKEMEEEKSQTTSGNSGTPFSSDSSSWGSGGESMIDELKKALGIKERPKPAAPACERACPMPNSPRDQNKKPFNQVQKKRRRSRRRSAKIVPKRKPGRRNVVFKKQPNAALKRQQRREKWKQYEKKEDAPSQYWHMMMIPNLSLKSLRR